MKNIERQAVVIIHGMGEQRPTTTLREFVKGVKWQMEQFDSREKDSKIRSKPDSVGDIYETVRLSLEGNFKTKRPKTDFYEFYWAHNMRGTTFSHMVTWLKQVILRRFSQVPQHLKKIWLMIWITLIICILTVGLFTLLFDIPLWLKTLVALFGGGLLSAALGAIGSFIKNSFLTSLGDVARYMTPDPDNISERSNIRQQGISFLKKMHQISNETRPDRIIVIGHSLGSVVSYDLLRLLWTEYNETYTSFPKHQPMADAIDGFAKDPNSIDRNPDAFSKAQFDFWEEAQALGNPWLITDFITLGAALNSIDYLMVNNVPISDLIFQRELPVCPPEIDEEDKTILYRKFFEVAPGKNRKGLNVPHHGAMFSMVRWTNIYFTSDFVGGPMRRLFGKGVKDLPIARKSLWLYPGGHTNYWEGVKGNKALEAIVRFMNLSNA